MPTPLNPDPAGREREALLARMSDKEHGPDEDPAPAGASGSYRTRPQRDRDRILYSSAFQRLAYVTQVTAPESGHVFHNRLSHSLKVAQVARRNTERLQDMVATKKINGAAARLVETLDADAVEASALAHDLGHPPFGHIAEEILNEAASPIVPDGFEGNAQSFRIVTRLSVRDANPGLDLTRQTLDGLLKYPWCHWLSDPMKKREHKWGYYKDDETAFRFARAYWPEEVPDALPARSLEAEIMDWADDLTYAVHDVDDFFRAGLIPLDRLQMTKGAEPAAVKELRRLLEAARLEFPQPVEASVVDQWIDDIRRVAGRYGPDEPYSHTNNNRQRMRDFGSRLITEYLEAFTIANDRRGRAVLKIEPSKQREVKALQMLVWVYVIRRPGLAVVQHGQERVIRELFEFYYRASDFDPKRGDHRLFPPGAMERLQAGGPEAGPRARVVVDLVASLTENAAVQLHRRMAGGWTAPTLDAMARMG